MRREKDELLSPSVRCTHSTQTHTRTHKKGRKEEMKGKGEQELHVIAKGDIFSLKH